MFPVLVVTVLWFVQACVLTEAIFFVFVVMKPLSVLIAPLFVEILSEFTFILLAFVPTLLALVEI